MLNMLLLYRTCWTPLPTFRFYCFTFVVVTRWNSHSRSTCQSFQSINFNQYIFSSEKIKVFLPLVIAFFAPAVFGTISRRNFRECGYLEALVPAATTREWRIPTRDIEHFGWSSSLTRGASATQWVPINKKRRRATSRSSSENFQLWQWFSSTFSVWCILTSLLSHRSFDSSRQTFLHRTILPNLSDHGCHVQI